MNEALRLWIQLTCHGVCYRTDCRNCIRIYGKDPRGYCGKWPIEDSEKIVKLTRLVAAKLKDEDTDNLEIIADEIAAIIDDH